MEYLILLKHRLGAIIASTLLVVFLVGCGDGAVSNIGGVGSNNTDPIPAANVQSATLMWNPTITNEDGTPVNDLAGYKVYYGTATGYYTASVDVGNVTTYVIDNLKSGQTYYFAVTSYDTSGNESVFDTEASLPL